MGPLVVSERGTTACDCTWRGVPTYVGGEPLNECPACETGPLVEAEWKDELVFPILAARRGRNEKCPCGSGQKVKRCHGAR